MRSTRHRDKSGEVMSNFSSDSNVFGYGHCQSFEGFSTPKRITTLQSQVTEFLFCRKQIVVSLKALLGCLSSLFQLVPGGHLLMRSLQLVLRSHWDFVDRSVFVEWNQEILSNLTWWSDAWYQIAGVSLVSPQPDLLFWSDVSDQGRGANLLDRFISGHWSHEEKLLSINLKELQTIHLSLNHFRFSLVGQPLAVFLDNTTALSYVRKQWGTFSPALNGEAQLLL